MTEDKKRRKIFTSKILFFLFLSIILFYPFLLPEYKDFQSAVGLLLGIGLALTVGNPFETYSKKLAPKFLSYSVVGLGFGMNFHHLIKVGLSGIGYTVSTIALTFFLGSLLSRLLKNRSEASLLVTTGTAICGGSAIAAIAPVIGAKNRDITLSMATIFILNALALFLFPKIGHYLQLTEKQFGIWSALAIHDTSSVVGATLQYGQEALEIGTTVKMARALWIIPMTFIFAFLQNQKVQGESIKNVKKPWFILGLLLAAALVTWIPSLTSLGPNIRDFAKGGLVVTLFLIGTNLQKESLREIGWKAFFHGIFLWLSMTVITLAAILAHWIEV